MSENPSGAYQPELMPDYEALASELGTGIVQAQLTWARHLLEGITVQDAFIQLYLEQQEDQQQDIIDSY